MDKNKKVKCSSKKHGEIDTINYYLQCNVYICKKREIFHSDILKTILYFNIRF